MILSQFRKLEVCKLSISSPVNRIAYQLVVIVTILSSSSSKSPAGASLGSPFRSTIPLDDLFGIDDEKYDDEPPKRSNKLHNVSTGWRQLIEQDESAYLNWSGDFVVKLSKFKSTHENDKLLAQTNRLIQAHNSSGSENQCGKSIGPGPSWESDKLKNETTGSSSQHNGNKRVFNGQNVTLGQFPWVVELKIFVSEFNKRLCTGTIISEWIILTAAHCVFECSSNQRAKMIEPDWISALVGRSNISWWQMNVEKADVQFRAIVSPTNYDPCRAQYEAQKDMVLLIASEPMKLRSKQWPESNLQRICLPKSEDKPLHGRAAVLAGWGETYFGSGRSLDLLWTTLTIDLGEKCSFTLPTNREQRLSVLCASGSTSGGCRGDSGAPLMIQDPPGVWTQIAIYSGYESKGGGHCSPVIKMIFARITSWLREMVETRTIEDIIGTKPKLPGFKSSR